MIRSLERNDVEMNALIEVNKSLKRAKDTILESCGELTLLDLGSGRLTLINDELHEETADGDTTGGANSGTTPPTAPTIDAKADTTPAPREKNQHNLTLAQKDVCVDFLLRMKLRRKLSNRLLRRLNRLAHAMDGKDVNPPSVPKYGDLRLHIDPKSIESWNLEWKEREDAKKRIQAAIDLDVLQSDTIGDIIGSSSSSSSSEEKKGEVGSSSSTSNEEKKGEHGSNGKDPNGDEPMGTGNSEQEKDSDAPPDETPSEEPSIQEPRDGSPVMGSTITSTQQTADTAAAAGQSSKEQTNYYSLPALRDDFKLLTEHESAYEKAWDASTKSFNYVMAATKEQDGKAVEEPEYKKLIKGGGIGATSVFTTLESLEAEHKRWRTNMLRRIKEQPTSEELGLKHHVFLLEERRKRCLEESPKDGEGVDGSDITNGESPSRKKRKMKGDDDNDNDGDADADGDEIETKKEKESGGDNMEEDNESDDDEETEGKDAKNAEIILKPKRSISFAAVPSFHDQDLARISMIHRVLLNSSQAELTRKRLADATNEYNPGKFVYINILYTLHTLLVASLRRCPRVMWSQRFALFILLTIPPSCVF